MRAGSTAVMPRQKHTTEFADEPRPWQRMLRLRAKRTMSSTVSGPTFNFFGGLKQRMSNFGMSATATE